MNMITVRKISFKLTISLGLLATGQLNSAAVATTETTAPARPTWPTAANKHGIDFSKKLETSDQYKQLIRGIYIEVNTTVVCPFAQCPDRDSGKRLTLKPLSVPSHLQSFHMSAAVKKERLLRAHRSTRTPAEIEQIISQ
ncbi:MAG TPA: hypothetical protein VJJ83_01215, partial [Candidatus Babeliales bacterium]|nr:hypothetical protein [Candidatus Babeliales bacterium]